MRLTSTLLVLGLSAVVTACSQHTFAPSLQTAESLAKPRSAMLWSYSFKGGADGANPFAGVIEKNGALYGTTFGGGAHGKGVVFSIGASGQDETVLHSFGGGNDGARPRGSLIDVSGTLYGTTLLGGAHGPGTVFGIAAGTERVLYSFYTQGDGANPDSSLTAFNGILYGTTVSGGLVDCSSCGTVFSIDPSRTGPSVERVLHRFRCLDDVLNCTDGKNPESNLVVLAGTLYGTTQNGGANQAGTIFSVSPSGTGERVLHSFGGGGDGSKPFGGLVELGGTLYGTTIRGGATGNGTVFALGTTGKERVIYSFKGGADGANPHAPLSKASGSAAGLMLYGTTYAGGSSGKGTVFRVCVCGTEAIVHSFSGTDGSQPFASVLDVNGTIYGTTDGGGANGVGTVFALRP